MLRFTPESQYWAIGRDTFGYCFFHRRVIGHEGEALSALPLDPPLR